MRASGKNAAPLQRALMAPSAAVEKKPASFRVRLSAASGRQVQVDFATDDGSARAPGDYSYRSGELAFSPGQTQKTVNVPAKGIRTTRPTRPSSYSSPLARGATIADGSGRATIRDDDASPGPTCDGRRATIIGDFSAEEIRGTSGPDVIVARAGADEIDALGGNHRVCAGLGADVVSGGEGSDRIFGEKGADRLDGGRGSDVLSGGEGSDWLFGRAGSDRLLGGPHEDNLRGGPGATR